MPFPDNSFDKTFCLGVLQHTPDFEESVRALVAKTKPGGEIVVDFYAIRRWWTKINAKYMLRPFTRKMNSAKLMTIIEKNIDGLVFAYRFLERIRLQPLTRFLPIADLSIVFPAGMSDEQIRDWSILDTFDMFSPDFDNPQKIATVMDMFERAGARVSFGGYIASGAAVVRAVKV